jgi:hypothetical protein
MTPVDGLVTTPSAFSAQETLARLKTAIAAAGLTVFAHIDHAAAARAVGLDSHTTAGALKDTQPHPRHCARPGPVAACGPGLTLQQG